ncbi:MAG TPA: hypothetical protein VKE70_06630 [Candidatus Solibacter sp.]|nr:hypothetical protein [Candidatus Solibacter sp.]
MGQAREVQALRSGRADGVVTLETRLLHANDVQCLDAPTPCASRSLGDGVLIQNLGTCTGLRQAELYNGRAVIRARLPNAEDVVSVRRTNCRPRC